MNRNRPTISRQAGLTLIETLVSIVVALAATLAITQTFAVSEGFRRSGTAGGDASFGGAIGTYLIDNDLAAAGYGINTATYLGCPVSFTDNTPPAGVTAPRTFAFTLAPALIVPGASAQATDELWLVAGNSDVMPGVINLAAAMAAATDNYNVTNAYGVNSGDLLVLAQPGLNNCTLVQATNTPTSQTTGQNLIKHAASGRYNPAAGVGPAYSATGVVMDLGPTPTVNRYYVTGNTLMLDQEVSANLNQPVAANVVQLKAFYGVDTVGDGMVHAWNNTLPTTAAQWASVLAVRVALVTQSANPEKPGAAGCTTTTVLPSATWDDGTKTTLDVSVTGSTATLSWQCFRYKVFHMTTSLRNQIWTPL